MKLIFLDVDGTLTEPGENTPPQSALEAIRRARAAGNRVFLCSGRSYAMLRPVLDYGFDGYIASAGGYVVCGGKLLYDCPMTEEQSRRVLSLLKESGIYRTVEALDGSFCDEGTAEFMSRVSGGSSELMRWRKALERRLNILPMRAYDGRPIYKVTFVCEGEERLRSVREALDAEFNIVVQDALPGSCVNGELINRRYDKGRGILRVAGELGVPVADTVGFGDSMNDLEMIETVGISVCMENGSAALKRRSSLVCPAVAEDGLAKAFARLGLSE